MQLFEWFEEDQFVSEKKCKVQWEGGCCIKYVASPRLSQFWNHYYVVWIKKLSELLLVGKKY